MAFKDGKYYADSPYGLVGDIGNWVGSQVSGSTNPASRSAKMNSMVTGSPYVTGLGDRTATMNSNENFLMGRANSLPKDNLPPKPTVVPMTNIPKPISTTTAKKGLGGSKGKSTIAVALPSLTTFPTAQAAPMDTQNIAGTLAQTPESYKQAYDVTAGEFNNALAYNNSNSGGLGDYAQIPDGNGGMIGVDQSAYDAIQNPTMGSEGSSNWVDGMSNFDAAQTGLGLFNTAFSTYDNLWGGGAKLRDKQMGLLDAKIADAQYNLKNKQGYDQSIRDTFGKKGL